MFMVIDDIGVSKTSDTIKGCLILLGWGFKITEDTVYFIYKETIVHILHFNSASYNHVEIQDLIEDELLSNIFCNLFTVYSLKKISRG